MPIDVSSAAEGTAGGISDGTILLSQAVVDNSNEDGSTSESDVSVTMATAPSPPPRIQCTLIVRAAFNVQRSIAAADGRNEVRLVDFDEDIHAAHVGAFP